MIFYEVANIFFFVFHTILILFNSLGWIWRKTRRYNLITLLCTAFSWFFLGIWYGWGYCFCTDWHWEVRSALGYSDQTNSYIDFLLIKLTGFNFEDTLVDQVTISVFMVSILASLLLNWKDKKQKI